jgi:hypothetical protein
MSAKNLPLKQRLLSESALADSISTVVSQLALYEAKSLIAENEIHPKQAAARIREQIQTTPDAATRNELKAQLSLYDGTGADAASHAARSELRTQYAPVRTAILEFLDASLTIANGYIQEAHSDEEALFSAWGLPVTPTIVSQRANQFIVELQLMRSNEVNIMRNILPGSIPVASGHRVLSFIGRTLL